MLCHFSRQKLVKKRLRKTKENRDRGSGKDLALFGFGFALYAQEGIRDGAQAVFWDIFATDGANAVFAVTDSN